MLQLNDFDKLELPYQIPHPPLRPTRDGESEDFTFRLEMSWALQSVLEQVLPLEPQQVLPLALRWEQAWP